MIGPTDPTTRAAIEAAIDELRAAFPPHPLDPSAAFETWGTTYLDGDAFRAGAHNKPWDELPAAFLEKHHDAPLFLGPPVFGDILPAYLAAALRRPPELDMLPAFLIGALTRDIDGNTRRFDAQVASLTNVQRTAVRHALEAWAAALNRPDRQRSIYDALDRYWRTIEE